MQQAICYLRVSSTGQVDGTGLDRQRESLEAFAKSAGYEIIATYADEGISGTVDGFDRPGLAELANNLEAGLVEVARHRDDLILQGQGPAIDGVVERRRDEAEDVADDAHRSGSLLGRVRGGCGAAVCRRSLTGW